jgi:cell division protein FtsB
MNQITVETNAVEIEAIEQVVANKEDAITELNFAQLAMVGGGEVVIIL